MDKLAGKRPSNPKREELRKHKSEWNKETSKLISNFIDLKRGMNGRAVPTHGIPTSYLKEPLPPQIGTYLNEVATSAAKIIEKAKSIMEEQRQYSESEEKRLHSNSAAEEEIIKMAEMINYASWWGSRLVSKFKFMSLSKEHRALLSDMMNSLVDVNDHLKLFEDNLLTFGKKGIPQAFTNLSTIAEEYTGAYLRRLSRLKEISTPKQLPPSSTSSLPTSPQAPGSSTSISRQPSPPSVAPAATSPDTSSGAAPPGTAPVTSPPTPLPATPPADASPLPPLTDVQIDEVGKEVLWADKLVGHIISNDKNLFISDNNLKTVLERDRKLFNNLVDSFKKRITSPVSAEPKDRVRLRRAYQSLKNLLSQVVLNRKLMDDDTWGPIGEGTTPIEDLKIDFHSIDDFDTIQNLAMILAVSNFFQVSPTSTPTTPSPTIASQDDNLLIYKEASAVENWFKEKLLNILPDSFQIIQLEIYKLSKKIRKQINIILNQLESFQVDYDENQAKDFDLEDEEPEEAEAGAESPSQEPTVKLETSLDQVVLETVEINNLFLELIDNMLKLGKIYSSLLRRSDKVKDAHKIDIKYNDISSLRMIKNEFKI